MGNSSEEFQQLAAKVDSLQRTVDRILAIVEQSQAQESAKEKAESPPQKEKGEEKRKRGPINWLQLSGDERRATWEGLAAFVEAIVFRYNLQLEIQPCWWQHADAVEELTALWQIRQNVFGERGDPTASYQWQNQLYNSRERLSGLFSSCREGHIDTTLTRWMSDDMRAEFKRAVHADSYGSGPPA